MAGMPPLPNEASIMRLIGAVLLVPIDEWQTSSRYMMVDAFAQIDKEEIDPNLSITTIAACSALRPPGKLRQLDVRDRNCW
jgi:hypothetical protein